MLGLSLGFGLSKKSYNNNQSDYFADNGGTFAWYSAPMGDKAVYDATSNKTWTAYEGWDGRRHVVYVNLYNHATGQWEGEYEAAPSLIIDDDHGVPTIHMDSNGYVHLISALHNSHFWHYVTQNPRDPTSWKLVTKINGKYTYNHLLEPSAENFVLINRESFTGYQTGTIFLSTAYNNGVITWGSPRQFADPGNGFRFYRGNCVVIGGKVHMVATISDSFDVWRRDIYYLIYDPATDQIENIQGTRTDAAANWPISYADLDTHYRIYEHDHSDPSEANQYAGSLPVVVENADNRPEVFFYNGLITGAGQYGGGFADIDILHMAWNGSAWSSPVSVAQVNQKYEEFYVSHLGDNDLEILYPDTTETSDIRGGNIASKKRINGVWQDPIAVKSYEYPRGLDRVIAVNKATDKFRFMFLEGAPSQDIDGIAISDDVKAGYQRIYAYGNEGLLKRSFTRTLELSTSTISAGRSIGDIVALIEGDHPRYTYSITNDPNSVFEIENAYLKLSDTVSAGSYPVTIQGAFRGVTVTKSFTLTAVAANSLEDKKIIELKLDEGTGLYINDSSLYGMDGVLGESATVTNDVNPSWNSSGLVFSGSTYKKATVAYNPLLSPSNMHLIAYFQTYGLHNANMVSRDSFHGTQKTWALETNRDNIRFIMLNGTSGAQTINLASTSAPVSLNTWYRVEVIVNGTSVKIILDGTEIASGTASASLPTSSNADLSLGAPFTIEENFNGALGYTAIYNQELTGDDLTAARAAANAAMTDKGVSL